MALREIVKLPDPILKTVSSPVEAVTDDVRKLLDDMLETMYDAPGIGLAAVQIGNTDTDIVLLPAPYTATDVETARIQFLPGNCSLIVLDTQSQKGTDNFSQLLVKRQRQR